jgi:Uma2 family endonuclease
MERNDARFYPRTMQYDESRDYGTLTVREYALLPQEAYGDLVAGRLVREPQPRTWHSIIESTITRELDAWVRPRALGLVLPECGFLLREEPPTVRGPDVAFVAAARIPAGGPPNEFWPGAPDLAVEVLSTTTRGLTWEKVADYLETGSRIVWVVDPLHRAVVVHEPDRPERTFAHEDLLDAEPLLPGFRLPVSRLFIDLPPR